MEYAEKKALVSHLAAKANHCFTPNDMARAYSAAADAVESGDYPGAMKPLLPVIAEIVKALTDLAESRASAMKAANDAKFDVGPRNLAWGEKMASDDALKAALAVLKSHGVALPDGAR